MNFCCQNSLFGVLMEQLCDLFWCLNQIYNINTNSQIFYSKQFVHSLVALQFTNSLAESILVLLIGSRTQKVKRKNNEKQKQTTKIIRWNENVNKKSKFKNRLFCWWRKIRKVSISWMAIIIIFKFRSDSASDLLFFHGIPISVVSKCQWDK